MPPHGLSPFVQLEEMNPRPVQYTKTMTRSLAAVYLEAREQVIDAGYAPEIDWQDARSLDRITESIFLEETAWVILSAGMRETVIRTLFPDISRAFCDWCSAAEIMDRHDTCIVEAMEVFHHTRKINAIANVAETLARQGFTTFYRRLRRDGVKFLERLPYIGPVTKFHLAKNLGLDVVKPDRHLVRIAAAVGLDEPETMCRLISSITGDRLATIDVVLWRYATMSSDYCTLFRSIHPIDQLGCQPPSKRVA